MGALPPYLLPTQRYKLISYTQHLPSCPKAKASALSLVSNCPMIRGILLGSMNSLTTMNFSILSNYELIVLVSLIISSFSSKRKRMSICEHLFLCSLFTSLNIDESKVNHLDLSVTECIFVFVFKYISRNVCSCFYLMYHNLVYCRGYC